LKQCRTKLTHEEVERGKLFEKLVKLKFNMEIGGQLLKEETTFEFLKL
jgi:hypothetical protein